MTIKYKNPQHIIIGERYLHCISCRGHEWEFVGENCVERFYDGGELDGEPYEECGDLYRCVGCTHIMEINNLEGYKGPLVEV